MEVSVNPVNTRNVLAAKISERWLFVLVEGKTVPEKPPVNLRFSRIVVSLWHQGLFANPIAVLLHIVEVPTNYMEGILVLAAGLCDMSRKPHSGTDLSGWRSEG